MLKWSLIILGVVLGLIALVALIGALLPRGHVASGRAKYRQPPRRLWEAISDFAAWPAWRKDIKAVERGEDLDGRPVWVEVSSRGRMPLAVEVMEAPSRMVTRIADKKLPFGGTWTFEIVESDGGATLTITEDGEIYNPVFRFMARFIFGYRGTLEGYLAALGKKFGEEVTVEPLR